LCLKLIFMRKIFIFLAVFNVTLVKAQSITQPIKWTQAEDTTKAKELGEVVVTGQYKPQSVKNSVYQVRVISNERIRLSGAATVQQVLNNQLGFRFSNDNALGISDVQLNGIGGNNVKILLDGVPMTDRYDQRVSLSQIDVNNIERIEIVEGPMSVSYGSDAMAGVINIITKKGTKDNLSVSARAQEETAGNEYYPFSYKGVHMQNVAVNYNKGRLVTALGGTHNDFDGFGGDSYGRGKTWKPKEQWFGNVKLGYSGKKFNAYYRLDKLNEDIVSRGPIGQNYKSLDQRYTTNRDIHQVQSEYYISSKLQWSGFIAYTGYNRETRTTQHDFEKNTDELTTGEGEQDISKLKSLAFKTTVQYKLSSKVSLQPGIDINHEKASGARITGSPEINDYALFTSAEIKFTDKISVRPGLRLTKNSRYDAPPVIPSINTKFVLSKQFDLRLAYGYGFRAPTLRELFLVFHDANHDLVGNPDLKAEYSQNVNGSLSWTPAVAKTVRLTSTLGAFYSAFRNRIELQQTTPTSPQYTYFNVGKVKTAGGSINNRLIWKDIEVSLGFSYTGYSASEFDNPAGYLKDDNRDFLWTPEINSNIIYNISKLKTKLGVFYKYIGKKPAFSYGTINTQPAILLTQTGSYNLADFTITTVINKFFTASLGAKNIFDVSDVNSTTVNTSASAHSSVGPQSIGYGRSYFLGLAFQWNKK
jgi:outer membrane receptor for ferrienterochelin and colicins